MEIGPILGLLVAIGAIIGGQYLEGGRISSILQPTAALIVCGGTAGAVLLQFPLAQIKRALADARRALQPARGLETVIDTVVQLAQRARRDGLVSLEKDAANIEDSFLRHAVGLAIDGVEATHLRELLEADLDQRDEDGETPARVFEAAGGYAPTVGILAAVLGLIHVMENLSEPTRLGAGIAVAFVGTVYGVGLANLVLLPLAGKLKICARDAQLRLEVALEGTVGLAQGENPRLLEQRLSIYLKERRAGNARAAAAEGARRVDKAA